MAWLIGIGKAVLGFLARIPWQAWLAIALLGLGLVYGSLQHKRGLREGRQEVQGKWDASVERGKKEVARLKAAAGKVTTKIEYRTVEKIKTVTLKGETREKLVKVFVPTSNNCSVGGGFRVFHDAAANNTIPDAASIATAAPTTVEAIASTVNENYTLCHKAYEVVAGWQQWADEQCAINKAGCPNGD